MSRVRAHTEGGAKPTRHGALRRQMSECKDSTALFGIRKGERGGRRGRERERERGARGRRKRGEEKGKEGRGEK